jgi:hypothetical protein
MELGKIIRPICACADGVAARATNAMMSDATQIDAFFNILILRVARSLYPLTPAAEQLCYLDGTIAWTSRDKSTAP